MRRVQTPPVRVTREGATGSGMQSQAETQHRVEVPASHRPLQLSAGTWKGEALPEAASSKGLESALSTTVWAQKKKIIKGKWMRDKWGR